MKLTKRQAERIVINKAKAVGRAAEAGYGMDANEIGALCYALDNLRKIEKQNRCPDSGQQPGKDKL